MIRRCLLMLLFVLAPILSFSAQAGQARVIGLDSTQSRSYIFVLEYGNGMARINLPDQPDSYVVYRDETPYLVTERSGIPMVFDLKATLKELDGSGLSAPRGPSFADIGRFEDLKATGKKETVAGLEGEIHQLSWLDNDNGRQTEEVVLTSDTRLQELSEVLHKIARTFNSASPVSHREGQERFLALLKARNLTILRYGRQMKVERITTAVVPQTRFELPSEPLLLPGLGGLLGR